MGANSGIYSLASLASQPAAVVHAFEPTPEIARRLRETAKLNCLDNLVVHEVGVSSRVGQAILRRFRGDAGTNEGMNFICQETGESSAERVETIRLDNFCDGHKIRHVDLLKLDVQGHEHSALLGAEHLITCGRVGTIFMELNWAHSGTNCPATESICRLDEAGYRFANPADCTRWQKAGSWLRSVSDVIARNTTSKTA